MITPRQFMSQYHQLNVTSDDGSQLTGLIVDHYRNNNSKPETQHHTGPGKSKLELIRTGIRKLGKTQTDVTHYQGQPVSDMAMRRTFAGKGAPREIAGTLAVAMRVGVIKPDGAGLRGPTQLFCDRYIGLDCNGFVSNYALAADVTRYGPSENAGIRLFNIVANRRQSIAAVRPFDVLIWTDNGHIAVIDSFDSFFTFNLADPQQRCFKVVESSGSSYIPNNPLPGEKGGLHESVYKIASVSKGIFTVVRHFGTRFQSTSRVYIVSMGLESPAPVVVAAQKPAGLSHATATGLGGARTTPRFGLAAPIRNFG